MVLGCGLNGYLNTFKKRGFGALGAVDDHKISAAPSVVSGLMPTSQIPFTEPVMPLAFRLRSAEATSGVDMETYPKIHRTSAISSCSNKNPKSKFVAGTDPIGSMYGIYTYIWLIFMVNVGKYTIHGSYGDGCKDII